MMTVRRLLWGTVLVLALFNVARGVGLFGPAADVIELALAFVLTVAALRGTLSRSDLGLEREHLASGLRWGGAAFALVVAVVVVAAVLPGTSGFLHDSRADVSAWQLLFDVTIRIGLLTVIPEELLFRGVLLGASIKEWGLRVGVVVASVLFGLWHIFPTLSTAGGNEQFSQADGSTAGRLGLVVGAVIFTTIAGLVFSWLRVRSRSIVAPMIAHLSTNGVALIVAWILAR